MTTSQTSIVKNFYVVSYWKTESWKIVCLCWCVMLLPRIFLKKLFFKHINTAASETSKKAVIFNNIAGCKTRLYIFLWNFIKLFMHIITIFSRHFFTEGEAKSALIFVKRSMLIWVYFIGNYFSRPRKGYS